MKEGAACWARKCLGKVDYGYALDSKVGQLSLMNEFLLVSCPGIELEETGGQAGMGNYERARPPQ